MSYLGFLGGVVATLVAGWFLKSFFPGYLDQKGKNLATKEDIAAITSEIEQVKAALGSQLHVHQVRYEQEFKILLELSEKLVALRDAAQQLRPEVGYGDPGDPEVRKARMTNYIDAGRAFYSFMEPRQPFFPEEIYQNLKALERATWKEFVQFKNQKPEEVPGYWDNALMNGAEIGTLATAALGRIRDRVRRWEKFDPLP